MPRQEGTGKSMAQHRMQRIRDSMYGDAVPNMAGHRNIGIGMAGHQLLPLYPLRESLCVT